MFQNLSLVVAKSLIESFGEEELIQCAMRVYMERSYEYKDDPHTPERWGKFKKMVDYLIPQAVTGEGEDNGGGKLGHRRQWEGAHRSCHTLDLCERW